MKISVFFSFISIFSFSKNIKMQKYKFTFLCWSKFLKERVFLFLKYFSGILINFSIVAIISILKNLEKVKVKYSFCSFFLSDEDLDSIQTIKLSKYFNLANLCRKNKYLLSVYFNINLDQKSRYIYTLSTLVSILYFIIYSSRGEKISFFKILF
jgi:hypothetical protein